MYKIHVARVKLSNFLSSSKLINTNQILIHLFPLTNLYALHILIIKDNEMQYFSNLFDKVLYMFRTDLLSIIRSISTLYTQQ